MKNDIVTLNGVESVELTAEELAAHEADMARIQAILDADYVQNRKAAYPSIGDQLDALFHAGVFPEEMAAQIQAVKDANPKPTE